ncbi:uncharacterized protein LOC129289402 [Prosopis cineraria]|uniref:uncharacterized protein LOC129289402 n=1 Tax=Prosopis cineraria TaxID=364024 RepID=UPI00240F7866|nr:uncharacterized protein LOC129289402 [Prosopis cineraria]
MESNVPAITKRVWNMVRVAFFMLRKGIFKGKIVMDLNMMLKRRGKLAGKAIANLVFHHLHHGSSASSHDPHLQFSAAGEYEFSCGNTPNYSFFPTKRHNRRHSHNPFFACAHAPLTQDDDMVAVSNALKVALEMLDNNNCSYNNYNKDEVEASPALPGFGRSPMVRQLRVTDSPFPVQDDDRDHQVDKEAEDFIKRFYKDLRKQA